MLRNQKQKMFHKFVLGQTVTADVNSASVETADIRSLAFLVVAGAFAFDGSNKVDLIIEDSDDGSSWETGGQYEAASLDAAGDASKSHLVEYRGNKKYARLKLDVTGTVSAVISVAAVSMHPEFQAPL